MGFEGVSNGGDRGIRITSETSRGERNRKALEISERLLFLSLQATPVFFFSSLRERRRINKLITSSTPLERQIEDNWHQKNYFLI